MHNLFPHMSNDSALTSPHRNLLQRLMSLIHVVQAVKSQQHLIQVVESLWNVKLFVNHTFVKRELVLYPGLHWKDVICNAKFFQVKETAVLKRYYIATQLRWKTGNQSKNFVLKKFRIICWATTNTAQHPETHYSIWLTSSKWHVYSIHMYECMYFAYVIWLTAINFTQLSLFHLKTVRKDFKQTKIWQYYVWQAEVLDSSWKYHLV